MIEKCLSFRIKRKIAYLFLHFIQYLRIKKYSLLSHSIIEGRPKLNQPALFLGEGKVVFKGSVNIGVCQSPLYLSTYAYIDARRKASLIVIEDGVWLNNNAFLCSDGAGIFIGRNTLAGINLQIVDSDFHNLEPDKRMGFPYPVKPVHIGENVFLGSNVKILKGVTIGNNSVIANGSIVTKDIPENVIAGGNPAKVLRSL
jgi:acetyltransferase-like isoleucine patch superfamily enzyme